MVGDDIHFAAMHKNIYFKLRISGYCKVAITFKKNKQWQICALGIDAAFFFVLALIHINMDLTYFVD
ncbi:hypothetical protein [Algibacter sp. L4_22]|uniref:hypothetical protein n=1 Tax=Algibacter sp. L4_22 TaxID=2942477 RepID=UPI00201B6B22|nr:hypothetical protein [Algibacter sp. L4_22]MCL5129066.1 hypothetical protein [Algibacter sp. L4_22]